MLFGVKKKKAVWIESLPSVVEEPLLMFTWGHQCTALFYGFIMVSEGHLYENSNGTLNLPCWV